jgi:hypothetical protein
MWRDWECSVSHMPSKQSPLGKQGQRTDRGQSGAVLAQPKSEYLVQGLSSGSNGTSRGATRIARYTPVLNKVGELCILREGKGCISQGDELTEGRDAAKKCIAV